MSKKLRDIAILTTMVLIFLIGLAVINLLMTLTQIEQDTATIVDFVTENEFIKTE